MKIIRKVLIMIMNLFTFPLMKSSKTIVFPNPPIYLSLKNKYIGINFSPSQLSTNSQLNSKIIPIGYFCRL